MFFTEKDLDHYDGKRYSKARGVEVLQGTDTTVQIWLPSPLLLICRCYITVPRSAIADLIGELQGFLDHPSKTT